MEERPDQIIFLIFSVTNVEDGGLRPCRRGEEEEEEEEEERGAGGEEEEEEGGLCSNKPS